MANNLCTVCQEPSSIIPSQNPFCQKCFLERMNKNYCSEIRKALDHTLRKSTRTILVVLDNTLSSITLRHLTTNNTISNIKYDYIRVSDLLNQIDNKYLDENKIENRNRIDFIRKIEEYAKNKKYHLVILSDYSIEVFQKIVSLLHSNRINDYNCIYNGNIRYNNTRISYPLFSWPYKSLLYYLYCNNLLEEPNYRDISFNKIEKIDNQLVRVLLNSSPASIFNLIKTQMKIQNNGYFDQIDK
ncbi:hypothetical protein NEOKW01_1541 [Nematocida sp. AWRm80]|nr:hypothetical protein NEOKW01_1541 [Nematocida sp. AWRm80]